MERRSCNGGLVKQAKPPCFPLEDLENGPMSGSLAQEIWDCQCKKTVTGPRLGKGGEGCGEGLGGRAVEEAQELQGSSAGQWAKVRRMHHKRHGVPWPGGTEGADSDFMQQGDSCQVAYPDQVQTLTGQLFGQQSMCTSVRSN